ncbi:MAG: phage baseplate plug family protein [Peptoanaerobacter stomatis]|uniref:phage baseplate plug family protein n=1 Tax=Peptoanaerobacter stomatis TaxID=796937 RepID=UPI003FA1753D
MSIASLEDIEYIKIEKELIPYKFTYDYKGNIFELEVNYNNEYDFFTLDLYIFENDDKTLLISGEKVVLSEMLFISISYLNIDIPSFIPYDFSNNYKKVGYDEIDDIYLVVVNDEFI